MMPRAESVDTDPKSLMEVATSLFRKTAPSSPTNFRASSQTDKLRVLEQAEERRKFFSRGLLSPAASDADASRESMAATPGPTRESAVWSARPVDDRPAARSWNTGNRFWCFAVVAIFLLALLLVWCLLKPVRWHGHDGDK